MRRKATKRTAPAELMVSPSEVLSASLTKTEARELEECVTTVQRFEQEYIAVGRALARIRDGRLYRATHRRFEDFCRERFGYSKRRIDQVVAASEVVAALGTIVPKKTTSLPTTESQARELVGLSPEQMREVWARACEVAAADGSSLTARSIRDARDEVAPTERPTVIRKRPIDAVLFLCETRNALYDAIARWPHTDYSELRRILTSALALIDRREQGES